MNDDGRDSEYEAYAHQLVLERERLTIEALDRCAAAGANPEDLNTLARECGINVTYRSHTGT